MQIQDERVANSQTVRGKKYDKSLHTMRRKHLSVEEAYNLVIKGKREEINLE